MKAGWKTVKLGEACKIVNGATPSTSVEANWGGPHCWITPAEMGGLSNPYVGETRRTLTDAGLADCSASLLPAGSVILSSRAPIGHVIINTVPMATNQGCKSMIPRGDLDAKFLFYFIKANVPLLESLGTGATFKELSGGKLASVEIPLPPLAEQKRIVALLDEAFAGIDEAKARAEAKHDLSQELRESYLESLLTAEDDWTDTTVANCADILTGYAFKSSGFSDSKNDVRLLGGDNIIAGAIRWENIRKWPKADTQNYQGFFLSIDDVVLAMDRPIVNTGLKISMISEEDVPALLIQRTARMRAKADVYPQFLYLTLSSKKFISYLSSSQKGVGVPHVSSRQIGSFGMKLPPREEQLRIVRLLSDIDAATKATSYNMARMVNDLHELQSSLLAKAFAGELTA